jgi:hypothetical protein
LQLDPSQFPNFIASEAPPMFLTPQLSWQLVPPSQAAAQLRSFKHEALPTHVVRVAQQLAARHGAHAPVPTLNCFGPGPIAEQLAASSPASVGEPLVPPAPAVPPEPEAPPAPAVPPPPAVPPAPALPPVPDPVVPPLPAEPPLPAVPALPPLPPEPALPEDPPLEEPELPQAAEQST